MCISTTYCYSACDFTLECCIFIQLRSILWKCYMKFYTSKCCLFLCPSKICLIIADNECLCSKMSKTKPILYLFKLPPVLSMRRPSRMCVWTDVCMFIRACVYTYMSAQKDTIRTSGCVCACECACKHIHMKFHSHCKCTVHVHACKQAWQIWQANLFSGGLRFHCNARMHNILQTTHCDTALQFYSVIKQQVFKRVFI